MLLPLLPALLAPCPHHPQPVLNPSVRAMHFNYKSEHVSPCLTSYSSSHLTWSESLNSYNGSQAPDDQDLSDFLSYLFPPHSLHSTLRSPCCSSNTPGNLRVFAPADPLLACLSFRNLHSQLLHLLLVFAQMSPPQ